MQLLLLLNICKYKGRQVPLEINIGESKVVYPKEQMDQMYVFMLLEITAGPMDQ